jgi:signal-transduction protein with cAMP-binding, CBS, and nucleotidyltransferase domain
MNAKNPILPLPENGRQTAPKDPLETAIGAHPLLAGMSPHQRRILMDCAMMCNFAPGELIFREGDPANRFYLIHKGKVALESYVRDRGTVLIQTISSGDILGWSWLFPPYYWHFDARAVEHTEAIFFYGTPLREECEADHDLGYELLKRITEVIIKRLQATRRQLLDSCGLRG